MTSPEPKWSPEAVATGAGRASPSDSKTASPAAAAPPVRVAYVLPVFAPGGSERQMLILAGALPRDRYAVEFILLGERTPIVAEAEALGIFVHVLGMPRRRTYGGPRFALAAIRTALRFVRLVRSRHYQIVDAWLFHAYALAGVTRPLTGVPVLVAGRRSLSRWKERFGRFDRLMDAVARRNADAIVANSEAVAADVVAFERIDPGRMRVIRNAVVDPATVGDREAIRRAWGIPAGAVLLGCVANPRPDKGVDVLLAALAAAPLPGNVHAVIVGDGPQRPELERWAHEAGLSACVDFVGELPDAREVYGAFDIVVGPSRAEGLPNSILEAAAAGCAIAATRAGGTPEILTDGETGLLVPVDDPAALRAAMDRLIGDRSLRERLGAAARVDVRRRFAVDRLVAETTALYASLLAMNLPT